MIRPVFNMQLSIYTISPIYTVGILGNHDYGEQWSDVRLADRLITVLEKQEIPILQNEVMELDGLTIGGVEDFWSPRYNLPKMLVNVPTDSAYLALVHNPDVSDQPHWEEMSATILCGHTHGGQIKPPFMDPPFVPLNNREYSSGFYQVSAERIMYINKGLGASRRLRFNCRPEISSFVITGRG